MRVLHHTREGISYLITKLINMRLPRRYIGRAIVDEG